MFSLALCALRKLFSMNTGKSKEEVQQTRGIAIIQVESVHPILCVQVAASDPRVAIGEPDAAPNTSCSRHCPDIPVAQQALPRHALHHSGCTGDILTPSWRVPGLNAQGLKHPWARTGARTAMSAMTPMGAPLVRPILGPSTAQKSEKPKIQIW